MTLTKDKKGDKPTGKYQVRFIDGAALEWHESEEVPARRLQSEVNRLIMDETKDYRNDILNDMKDLLSIKSGLTAQTAVDFEELAEHFDAIRLPPVHLIENGDHLLMSLNMKWGMFFKGTKEEADETNKIATEWADIIQKILGRIRDYPLREVTSQVTDFLEKYTED